MSNNYGPRIVTDGLVLCLDAADRNSYPLSGDRWYDLSGQNAHCDSLGSPTFFDNGSSSYWQMRDGQKFNSVDISQEYRDLFVIFKLESNASGPDMIFGKYNNQDYSFRTNNSTIRSSTNVNDWENTQTSKTFLNGVFNAGGTNVYNRWVFARAYRSNTGFGTSFRYEVSSAFFSGQRHFYGLINYIACYNRELDNTEVLQNYNALKGRFGL